MLRGRVLDGAGAPLPGVRVTVLGHPELGTTWTRADGMFDLAVNGGGVLTVRYEKPGYLPAQRTVDVPWQDYTPLPEVVLIGLDVQVTPIQAGAADVQVATGSPVTDADGTRQAVLLVPAGTTATMVLPDGTEQALSTFTVRATEYTVGPTGPAAMPAELPPTSGYTYAVEFSADEALAAGATTVRFSQPLVQYLENFLAIPVGTEIPVGAYDRDRAAWVPERNGRVVRLLAITNGLAELDVDGDGQVDGGAALVALGITDAERQRLATRYAPGQSLWRVPITHFTPWDSNWGIGCDPSASACTGTRDEVRPPTPEACAALASGSIIECQNQILGETLPVTGTGLALNYRSDRVPGRLAARTVDIPLSGAQVPTGLQRIELELAVAGQRFSQSFPALANQRTTFTWNGEDAYGRPLQGQQPLRVRVGYVYPAVYLQPGALAATFGYNGGGLISGSRARREVTVWREFQVPVGAWDARAQGLGGWSLDVHHAYDPLGRILYLGTGERRTTQQVERVIGTTAGTGTAGYGG